MSKYDITVIIKQMPSDEAILEAYKVMVEIHNQTEQRKQNES